MSSPWSVPDAARQGAVPPPPPPAPHAAHAWPAAPGQVAPPAADRADNPFAPPSDDDLPVGPAGGVYGQHVPYGAYGPPPVWPTLPPHDGLAVAALVCGIVGLVILPIPLSQIALGLGIASLVRINRGTRRGKGLAVTGVVLGGLGTVGLLAVGALFGAMMWVGPGL